MKADSIAARRGKAHQRYYTKNGELVPGVTTVLNVLAKPALVPWANKLGLQGIEVGKYVDTLAEIGSIAHEMVLCHHHGQTFDGSPYPPVLVDKAENALLSYYEWEKGKEIEPILCESVLVSERCGFGGTVDFYGKVDGEFQLVDYKTSKALWPEHKFQVSAYRQLLIENGHRVDRVRVLRIGRDETEGFEDYPVLPEELERGWAIFEHCLALHKLKAVGR